jgi:hypothetical protein
VPANPAPSAPVACRKDRVESGFRELPANHAHPVAESVPDTVFAGRRAECSDTYPALVYLSDKRRMIECLDRLQWILQRRRSVCPNSWRGISFCHSFCHTRESLLWCAGSGNPAAMARLRALAGTFSRGPANLMRSAGASLRQSAAYPTLSRGEARSVNEQGRASSISRSGSLSPLVIFITQGRIVWILCTLTSLNGK